MLEIILSLIYIAIFLFIMGKMPLFKTGKVDLKVFRGLFLIKLLAAFALYLIYTRFYPDRKYADIFRYYDDSKIMFDALSKSPSDFFRMLTGYHSNADDLWHYYDAMRNWFNSEMIFNDSRTMIRLNTILRFFVFGTYFPIAVIMSFLGLIGLTGIYRVFISVIPGREFWLMCIVYLLPSILLWTSGMIKETFLNFSIGMLLYYIHNALLQKKIGLLQLTGILIFSFCLLNIKSYILFAVLPGIVSWIVCSKIHSKRLLTSIGIHALYFVFLFNASPLITHHTVAEILTDKQQEFYFVAEREQAKSIIELPPLDGTFSSLVKNIPSAYITTLARPHLAESSNPLVLIAALENAIIILFIILCIVDLRKGLTTALPSFFYLAVFFSTIMFVLIGWVTPILGAIVRYKVPALPFLLVTFLLFSSSKWISWKPSFLKKYFA